MERGPRRPVFFCDTGASAVSEPSDLSSLVESLGAIVWEADPETFQFLFVSAHAEAILGYPVRQWIDEPDFWRCSHASGRRAVVHRVLPGFGEERTGSSVRVPHDRRRWPGRVAARRRHGRALRERRDANARVHDGHHGPENGRGGAARPRAATPARIRGGVDGHGRARPCPQSHDVLRQPGSRPRLRARHR